MMKRKFLAVVLPIIGCVTVVGSGFSAWYFSDGVYSNDLNKDINFSTTDEIKNEMFTFKETNTFGGDNPDTLVLDQGGYNNREKPNVGIMLGTSNDKSVYDKEFKWEAQIIYGANESITETLKSLSEAGYTVSFDISITIPDGLDYFIKVTNNNVIKVAPGEDDGVFDGHFATSETSDPSQIKDQNDTKYTFSYVETNLSNIDSTDYTWYIGIDFSTINLTNNVFTYRNKPFDTSTLSQLKELTGKIKLDVSVDIVPPNAIQ